jgi:hypothetical protein
VEVAPGAKVPPHSDLIGTDFPAEAAMTRRSRAASESAKSGRPEPEGPAGAKKPAKSKPIKSKP